MKVPGMHMPIEESPDGEEV
jgi:hypothetical protein